MRKRNAMSAVAAIVGVLLGASCSSSTKPGSTSGTNRSAGGTQGVTATSIRVGIPYVDVGAVKAVGVSINWGNVPDAYKAIIADINAHGGINGRRIVPYIIGVNPTGTAPAATACTQLAKDDKVFVAIAPLQPTCYLQNGIPTVGAILQTTSPPGLAQNFALTPPTTAYDPLQLSVYAKQGVFDGKKVAVFAGTTTDQQEMKIVETELGKVHVDVVDTAVDSAPEGDLPSENQQVAVIAQRFHSAGANLVVAVGYGSSIWPEALTAIQSSYNPPWVATSEADFTGDVGGTNNPKYLENVTTSSPIPIGESVWANPDTQRCVSLVRKAYPSDHINAYSPTLPGSQSTWIGVEQACTDLGLFEDIAKAAGKDLTVASFMQAGYGLRNVVVPGYTAPVSFGPNQPYALGGVYMAHYDPGTKSVVVADNPVSK